MSTETPEPDAKDSIELQLQFARHNFDNLQSLIRASDTKAGVTVTVIVFLAASALQITKDAITKLNYHPLFAGIGGFIFIIGAVGLFISVLLSFVMVYRVLRPRGARHTRPEKGRELMWQEHVLLYADNEIYFAAVRAASAELVLRNLTDQVYELAHISSEKMKALASFRLLLMLGFGSWTLIIVTGLFLARY